MFGILALKSCRQNPYLLNDLLDPLLINCGVTFSTNSEVFVTVDANDIPPFQEQLVVIAHRHGIEQSYNIPVPTKGSSVTCWFEGNLNNNEELTAFTNITDKAYSDHGYAPAKLLIRLNSSRHPALSSVESNYTDLIKKRVIEKLQGSFSLTLAYLTMNSRSRITVASKDKTLYFFLAYTADTAALVWTDEQELFRKFKDNGFLIYNMAPMAYSGVMVLHPGYIVGKWRKWTALSGQTGLGIIQAVSILESYLERHTLAIEPTQEVM